MSETTHLLRLPDVIRATGLSRNTIYRLIHAGAFPEPIRVTERTSAWESKAVDEYIAGRPRGLRKADELRAANG